MTTRYEYRSSSAFTIVELLVVIVVIGILAAITIVSYTGISSRATVSSLQSDLTNAVTQLKLDQVNSSSSAFPATLALANGGKGISSSSGTTYTYAVSNTTTPQTFCITATKNNISYNITGDGNSQPGICPVLNLDAGNISSYPGTGTTWTDLSGNGNNGTLVGGVTYSNTNGGVMSFDGVNDYVRVPNDIVTIASERLNGVSYSAWVKSTNTLAEQRIVGQKPHSGYSDFASGGLGISSGRAKMVAYDDTLVYKYSTGTTSLQNNLWYYITGTYDNSDKNIRIYVNGLIDGTAVPIITFSTLSANSENVIGAKSLTGTYSFTGLISNVNIYGRVLTADEIQQNFNAQRGRYGI